MDDLSELSRDLIAVRDSRDRAAFGRLFDHFAPRLKAMMLRGGLRDGKIAIFNPDLLDWLTYAPADRATTPVRFWLTMFIQAIAMAAGVAIVILGWVPAS